MEINSNRDVLMGLTAYQVLIQNLISGDVSIVEVTQMDLTLKIMSDYIVGKDRENWLALRSVYDAWIDENVSKKLKETGRHGL